MLDNKYDFKKVEEGKYEGWLKHGYFSCGDLSKKPYSIVIPPPNVTGKLHLGHAMDNAMQDLLARYHRLKGEDVLWVPGMDHAGIATQAKVDERLKEHGISRYDIGREKFLEKAWEWKDEYADHIHKQWARFGISVDYAKERFTLDEGLSNAVKKVFVEYYKEGLIYQGKRIINWDPEAKTALSNIEVIHKDVKGKMYYFLYDVVDSDETFEVATTRPETMFGDVCVVVNPNDEGLNHLIGKKCINPANGDILPIIGDEYIEIGFGSGAMKCTPAHDPNDYQIALRHGLDMPICMNEDATMNELAGEFNGLDRYECREKVVQRIKDEGHFIKEEEIMHSVGHSERTGVMVEPYLSKQWFVKMKPLADAVLEKQKDPKTKINFYPKRFEKTFIGWLENIEDWCISRQLWWGHRIPVYYHNETGEIYCEIDPPKDIENWHQDEDVLDTWFSSALWPFSVFGWPEETEDLKRYFPTSCLVTGYDIIFFWVARMAFSARHFMDDVPFRDCLIHGLIRDEKGRKMSKSLGNGIDPLDIIDKYGCDALRYYILTNAAPGLDTNYSTQKLEAAWNFINKLYNAARFVLMNREDKDIKIEARPHTIYDHWIYDRLNKTIDQVTMNLDRYEFGIAGNELSDFIWNDFCSNYIEFAKSSLNDPKLKEDTLKNLIYILDKIAILIHPYLPFVSEEIYQEIHSKEESVCIAHWPDKIEGIDQNLADNAQTIIQIIKQVRELRSENDIKPSKDLHMQATVSFTIDQNMKDTLYKMCHVLVVDKIENETLVRPIGEDKIEFAMEEIVDVKEEIAKIEKELEGLKAELARSNHILANPSFLNKAPAFKVQEEKDKQAKYQASYDTLVAKLEELKVRI